MQIPGVGILKKWTSMRKFQGLIKKELGFLGVIKWSRKNHMEFPWVLIFGLVGISKPKKEHTTILQNFMGCTLFSLEFTISKGKVTNLKFQGFFKCPPVLNNCLCLDVFSGITPFTRYPSRIVTVPFESTQSQSVSIYLPQNKTMKKNTYKIY